MITTCARKGCHTQIETDGRRRYCSRRCQLLVWRHGAEGIPTPRHPPRPHRVSSGYTDSEHDQLVWLADEDGVTPGQLQRAIVTAYLERH